MPTRQMQNTLRRAPHVRERRRVECFGRVDAVRTQRGIDRVRLRQQPTDHGVLLRGEAAERVEHHRTAAKDRVFRKIVGQPRQRVRVVGIALCHKRVVRL